LEGAPRTLKQAKIPYITIWQYWLGNTKAKKAFKLILNTFKKLLQNFKIKVVIKPGMERIGMEPIRARATRKICFKIIAHRLKLSIETNIVLEIVGF